jgi:hypothetical protein
MIMSLLAKTFKNKNETEDALLRAGHKYESQQLCSPLLCDGVLKWVMLLGSSTSILLGPIVNRFALGNGQRRSAEL